MPDDLHDLLYRLRTEHGLDLAAVAADGLLLGVEAAPGTDLDAEGICLDAGDIYLMKTALGAQMGRGAPRMLTCEYEAGTLIVCGLGHGAELVLLAGTEPNLGRLRVAARRFGEQFLGAAPTPEPALAAV